MDGSISLKSRTPGVLRDWLDVVCLAPTVFGGVLPFRKNAGKMQGRLKNAVNSNILEVVFFTHFLSQNELVW